MPPRLDTKVVGDSVLTSIRITWADAIDYFVKGLLEDGRWPTTSNGSAIDYWPGVSDDPGVNLLSDFSSRVAFQNLLDIESRLATMRQGVDPRVFCGYFSKSDGGGINASAFADQNTGDACNASQLEAPDSSCCLTDSHLRNEMTYLIEGGFYPNSSDSKWGTFDGFGYSAPPWLPELIVAPQDITVDAVKPRDISYEPLLLVNPNKVELSINISTTQNATRHAGLHMLALDATPRSFLLQPGEYKEVKIDLKTLGLESDKYRLQLLIHAQTATSLPVTSSVGIQAVVRALIDRNTTQVSVLGRPTLGEVWAGVKVEMRDSDGFLIIEESASQIFSTSLLLVREGSTIASATCTRRWFGRKYVFDCIVPKAAPAGDWSIEVTLDQKIFFRTTVRVKCPTYTYEHHDTSLCNPCPQGTSCDEEGIVEENLPVMPGYWRSGECVGDTFRIFGMWVFNRPSNW